MKIPAGELGQKVKELLGLSVKAFSSQPVMLAVATEGVDIIGVRTRDGEVDKEGQKFSALSTERTYISKRHKPVPKGGQKTRGGRSIRYDGGYAQYKRDTLGRGCNLSATDDMLGSMLPYAGQGRAVIRISGVDRNGASNAAKAQGHIDSGRDFFGVGEISSERARLKATAEAQAQREVNRVK